MKGGYGGTHERKRNIKFSDAGSRKSAHSFATHKRGMPKTLWQRGAMFSTRLSRASVSAGKHVPQFYGNHNMKIPSIMMESNGMGAGNIN